MKQILRKYLMKLWGEKENCKAAPEPNDAPAPTESSDIDRTDNDRQSFLRFRKLKWEDDISLNHDSTEPFENAISPAQMPAESFEIWSRLNGQLLDGVPVIRFAARDTYPVPHARDREGYQVNYDARYFLNGLADYLKILGAVEKHQISMKSFLDFGCASGRVLRHFCAQSEIQNLWGCDINGRHVKWMNDHLPSN